MQIKYIEKMKHPQEVIEVEKTVSPKRLREAPNDLPLKVSPDLR